MDFTDLETPCILLPLPLSFSDAASVEEFDPLLDTTDVDVKQEVEFKSDDEPAPEIPARAVAVKKINIVQLNQMVLRARAMKSSSSSTRNLDIPNLDLKKAKQNQVQVQNKRSRSQRSPRQRTEEKIKKIESTATEMKKKPRKGITLTLTSSDVNPTTSPDVATTTSKIKDLLSNFCESNCKICDELILKLSQHFSSNHQNPDPGPDPEHQSEDSDSDSIHDGKDEDDSPTPGAVNTESESESDLDLDLDIDLDPKKKKTKYPRRFTCSICPGKKRFTHKVNFDEHMKKIHAKESMAAISMAVTTNDERKMQIQAQIMDKALQLARASVKGQPDDPSKVNFTCTECGAQFRSARGLCFHFRADHPGQKLQYNCTICGGNKKFPTMFHLKAHVAQAHCSKKEWEKLYPFPCTYDKAKCERRFKVKSHLDAHMRKCHPPGGENPFKCKTCDKTYKNAKTLSAHVTTAHDKSRMRTCMCEECGKCFSKPDKLKIHKMIHTGERPHICDQCGKSFVQKNGLNDHYYKIHTGERPFKCEVCGKGYILAGNLRCHMKNHHNS